jgi:hypothetical protein
MPAMKMYTPEDVVTELGSVELGSEHGGNRCSEPGGSLQPSHGRNHDRLVSAENGWIGSNGTEQSSKMKREDCHSPDRVVMAAFELPAC